jgi:hypothetical protein
MAASVLLLLLVVLAAGLLNVNHTFAAAARRSVAFRWHYWQATVHMIAEHPILGCGPGNFGDAYTAYKLPEAYEEVADPHNFVLEVWATAGTAAMLALLAAIGWFFSRVLRVDTEARRASKKNSPVAEVAKSFGGRPKVWATSATVGTNPSAARPTEAPSEDHAQVRPLLIGATLGLVVAYLLAQVFNAAMDSALSWQALMIVGCGGATTLAFLYQWIVYGRLPPLLVAVGCFVLLVHLLASGGIANPGLAGSLWLLLAIGLNLTGRADREVHVPKFAAYSVVALALLLVVLFQRTAYGPSVHMHSTMAAARRAGVKGDIQDMRDQLQKAADADVWAAAPRRRLTEEIFRDLLIQLPGGTPETLARLRSKLPAAINGWLKLVPYSSSARGQVGAMYLQLYRAGGDRSDLFAALDAYRHATRLYPNSSLLQAHLAWVHHLAGNSREAADIAARALQLDRLTPYEDRKLGSDYWSSADPEAARWRGEELMRKLLSN